MDKLIAREGWESRPRQARGGGQEYPFRALPEETQIALMKRDVAKGRAAGKRGPRGKHEWTEGAIAAAWARYDRLPNRHKLEAQRRLEALDLLRRLRAAGTPVGEAREQVLAQLELDVSVATLRRWERAVRGAHRTYWLALVAPQYSGRTTTAQMPAEAWDLYKADWLRLEQPTAASCYDRLVRIGEARGWADALPSLRTFQRRVERELPRGVIVLARQGEEALAKLYPAQQRDKREFAAMTAVNADGHRWDVMVRMPDGTVGRPLIVAWQDIYSGKILSWRLSDTESTDVVQLSFADMVRRYGVPAHAWLDNGRAFASKAMTAGTRTRYRFAIKDEDPIGLMTGLGIEVHWSTPYHGQAKPIERAWRDICDRIAKHPAFAGAYTGNSPDAKPENYGSRAVAWDEFAAVVESEVAAHNARTGRRSATCNGRSFDETFGESYAHTITPRATEEQLRMLLLMAKPLTVRQDGAHLLGNRYWSEALTQHVGERVVLRVDPEDLHAEAYIYGLDGTYLCAAECTHSAGFGDREAAREHARGKTQYRRAQKDMLDAERRMDAAQVAAALPPVAPGAAPAKRADVLAGVFHRHGPARPRRNDDEAPAELTPAEKLVTRLADRLNQQVI